MFFLQTLLAETETEIERESAHLKFCGSMEITSENTGHNVFKPLPPSMLDGYSSNKVSIGGFYNCVGCGFPFDATVLDAFSLACRHVYHMLCFAHVCRDYGYCVALDCNEPVPARAKLMLGQKIRIVKKEPSAGKFRI